VDLRHEPGIPDRERREALGGGLDGPGAIVSGGMIYFNSGYGGFVGNPATCYLAFGVE
jgi:hypothetical protein